MSTLYPNVGGTGTADHMVRSRPSAYNEKAMKTARRDLARAQFFAPGGSLLAPLAVLLGACGGSDGGSGGSGAALEPTCAEDQVVLRGTLGGQPVFVQAEVGNYMWIQSGESKTFDATFEGGGAVHAEWDPLLPEGATTTMTGSVTLPAAAPRAGSTLAGEGSLTKLGDEVRFDLAGLSESVACITEPCPAARVDGSLTGCVRKRPFSF
jgi:hypothetical protein